MHVRQSYLLPAGAIIFALAIISNAAPVHAQSASLLGAPGERQGLTLANNSWFFLEVEPPPELRLHDIVTVIVDEKSQVISEAEVDRRKTANLAAQLQDWIRLEGFDIKPAPQSEGDPTIEGSVNSRYRAKSELETRDGMKFRIATEVVDIRPNGNLVLEGHRSIKNNNEVWEYSLSGIIRREDLAPDNTVLSEDIAELQIHKREQGHVRDGYRRGWLLKMLDSVQPF